MSKGFKNINVKVKPIGSVSKRKKIDRKNFFKSFQNYNFLGDIENQNKKQTKRIKVFKKIRNIEQKKKNISNKDKKNNFNKEFIEFPKHGNIPQEKSIKEKENKLDEKSILSQQTIGKKLYNNNPFIFNKNIILNGSNNEIKNLFSSNTININININIDKNINLKSQNIEHRENSNNSNSKSNSIFDKTIKDSFFLNLLSDESNINNNNNNKINDINFFRTFAKQIKDFVQHEQLNEEENEKRNRTFAILKKYLYNSKFKRGQLYLYGSFPEGISTKSSNLDVVILSKENNIELNDFLFSKVHSNLYNFRFKLKEIYNFLSEDFFSFCNIYFTSRIQVIKGICKETGIEINISLDKICGLDAINIIKPILDSNQKIKEAVILIKTLLKNNELNKPVFGGMNCYLTIHLIFAYYLIELRKKSAEPYLFETKRFYSYTSNYNIFYLSDKRINKDIIIKELKNDIDINVGEFIFNFFEFFCSDNKKNYSYKILFNEGKIIKEKKEHSYLKVEDLQNFDNDIGSNCRDFESILNLFEKTFNIIKYFKNENNILDNNIVKAILQKRKRNKNYFINNNDFKY